MKIRDLVRFRLWHLLFLVLVSSYVLWLATQAGMRKCEIEIVEIGYEHDNLSDGSNPVWTRLLLRYHLPKEKSDYDTVLFLADVVPQKTFREGDRIRFRYREKQVLWFQRQDPDVIARQKLAIAKDDIEESISEKNWQND